VARSADYKCVGGLPPFPGLLYADTMGWYRLTALAYKIHAPEPLAAFRLHTGSATRSSFLVTYYEASCQYLVGVRELVAEPDEYALAQAHITKAFQLKQRQVVRDIIRDYSPVRWRDYMQDKEKLAAVIAEKSIFDPHDLYTTFLEKISGMPNNDLRQRSLAMMDMVINGARAVKKHL
jgi:hypothetical protein